MNLAKSLIASKKNYSNQRTPMQWNGSFWPKISPVFAFRLQRSIRYSRTKHAVHSYLRNQTTAQTKYLMGSTVNNLLKLWVHKLSFLKRHPSNQKGKIMKQRALIAVIKEILFFSPSVGGTPRLIDWPNTGRRILPNHRLSMESNCRPQLR
jgi:hypothetical protein